MTNRHILTEYKYTGVDILDALSQAVRYNRFLAGLVLEHSGGAREMVDFGAGLGTAALLLRDAGRTVVCVEDDPALLSGLGAMGFACQRDLGGIAPGSAEYVYSLNVLEHIEDDLGALRRIHEALKPGGRLFLYLPAFMVLYGGMDRKVGHFRRYTMEGAVKLAEEAGFSVTRARYADSLGFFAALVFNALGREDVKPGPVQIYDTLVFPVSRMLDFFVGGVLGKNVMVAAVKGRG